MAETLKRLSTLRATLADEKSKALLSSSDALPSPPETYLCLSDALQRDESSTRVFAEIIESDPVLSANLLEVVNSTAFGLSVQIDNIQELFEVIGVHVARSLILSLHTKDFFQPRTRNRALFDELWEHALETAARSRKLASLERLSFRECQTCYVAGLLHDIGQFVLAAQVNYANAGECPNRQALLKFEQEKLGITHSAIGAYLLGLWGLPEPVVITAELHHTLEAVPTHAYNPIIYVHAAENILKSSQSSELDLNFLRKAGKAERFAVWREALAQTRS